MNLIIHLLLFSSFSILICKANLPPLTEGFIEKYIRSGKTDLTGSAGHDIKLSPGGILGETRHSIVWQGTYNNQQVAIKLVWDRRFMDQEIEVYTALNALQDPNIEQKGIPRIYYYGPIFNKYFAIAMSLFEGTPEDCLAWPSFNIKGWSLAVIFRRALETLEYIHKKKVIHNDIKPKNLFLRGKEVFIGDFDSATINGAYSNAQTTKYASTKWHDGKKQRYEMDDLESLLFSMWELAGCEPDSPYGESLLRFKKENRAEAKMKKKCAYFGNSHIIAAFETVCKEILSDKTVPNYNLIYQAMDDAIAKVTSETGQTEFEWLKKNQFPYVLQSENLQNERELSRVNNNTKNKI